LLERHLTGTSIIDLDRPIPHPLQALPPLLRERLPDFHAFLTGFTDAFGFLTGISVSGNLTLRLAPGIVQSLLLARK
jgi:hypothetical protein